MSQIFHIPYSITVTNCILSRISSFPSIAILFLLTFAFLYSGCYIEVRNGIRSFEMVEKEVNATPKVRKEHLRRDIFEQISEKIDNKLRQRFILYKDKDKRPSDLEIQRLGLPKNTPTLGQRAMRDSYNRFVEPHFKSGYYEGKTGTWRDKYEGYTTRRFLETARADIKEQFKLCRKEVLSEPYDAIPVAGDIKIEYKFDSDEAVKNWIVTSDSTWGEGYSTCEFKRSPSGKGLFCGELSTRVPQDGRIKRTGYCNIASGPKFKSFWRYEDLMWDFYSALYMKIRGDGRTYKVNIHTETRFDLEQNDLHSYFLYTRGGPYWQTVKIPFSKFIFINRGRIQDKQEGLPLRDVIGISITLADRMDGPFSLELDDIGVYSGYCDLPETCAYESYIFPRRNYTQL